MNPRRILVVDDEKNQRDILQMILAGERDETGEMGEAGVPLYDVQTASSGQEALRRFRSERFDLVVTDLKMAGMDGIQLLTELKSKAEYKSVPVIMITTEGGEAKVMEAVQLGAAGYVRKPFTADQIKQKLDGLFN